MVDLILVNPGGKKKIYSSLASSLAGIEPPVWLALLASFIKKDNFTVSIIDAEAMSFTTEETVEKILSLNGSLVGIGAIGSNPSAASTPKMVELRNILEILKKLNPEQKTFVFGIHPSALPERTLLEEKTDFVIKGEPFIPVLSLLKNIRDKNEKFYEGIKGVWYKENGSIVNSGWADVVQNLDTLPFAAWELLPMERYRAHNWQCFSNIKVRSPYAVLYTSFGCPYHCYYCNIHELYGGKPGLRLRSPENVIKEIDFLYEKYNVKILKIMDELFAIDTPRVRRICNMLIERNYGLNIWAYARVDTVNPDLLTLLKKAGIQWLAFGIEAESSLVRAGVNKDRFDRKKISEAIKMTHDAGINVMGNFMFGLPDDNIQTMQDTLILSKELLCDYVNFYTTMAYPGSLLYEDALKNNLPLPDSWEGYSQFSYETLPLPTKYLSAVEVLKFRDDAFKEYFSNPAYLDMIEKKFGLEVKKHILDMLTLSLKRKILEKG